MEPFHGYRAREIVNGKEVVRYIEGETGDIRDSMEYNATPLAEKKRRGQAPDARVPDFVRSWRTNVRTLAKDKDKDMSMFGLLYFLTHATGWETTLVVGDKGIPLCESEIADTLSMSRSHVHDTLAKLHRKGYISLVKHGGGRPNLVMVNPNVAFFGKYMRDMDECAAFSEVDYKPALWIPYKEAPKRE